MSKLLAEGKVCEPGPEVFGEDSHQPLAAPVKVLATLYGVISAVPVSVTRRKSPESGAWGWPSRIPASRREGIYKLHSEVSATAQQPLLPGCLGWRLQLDIV